jgi:thiol-disulfide isomerase/thioredoxin
LINLPQPLPRRVAALVSATAMAAVLYGGGPSGKEGAARAGDAPACAGSSKIAAAVAPLAKGDVAALAISKKPEPIEPYAFQDPEGKPVSLATFRGRTVLLNLWATWCVPCRGEMPELDKLQTALGSDKFEVVAINVDTSRPERPKALFQELGLKSLKRYADPKANIFFEMKQAGKALGLPLTLLIDPEGCQIGLINGPAAWGSGDARALVTRAVEAAAP